MFKIGQNWGKIANYPPQCSTKIGTTVYKICYKLIDIAFDEFFTYAESCYNLRSHNLCIRSEYLSKHDSFRHFFSNRVVSVWNLLPESIVSSTSFSGFKIRLKKFDLHEFRPPRGGAGGDKALRPTEFRGLMSRSIGFRKAVGFSDSEDFFFCFLF